MHSKCNRNAVRRRWPVRQYDTVPWITHCAEGIGTPRIGPKNSLKNFKNIFLPLSINIIFVSIRRRHDHVELFHDFEQLPADSARRRQPDRHERLGRRVHVLRVLQFRGIRRGKQHGKEDS